MTENETARELMRARESASAPTEKVMRFGAVDLCPFVQSAQVALAKAAGLEAKLTGAPPSDAATLAADEVIAAATAFMAVAQAHRETLASPAKWRENGSAVDLALRELGL